VNQLARQLEPVLGRKRPALEVAARDFARPRRLAPERAQELALALENRLPALAKELHAGTGLHIEPRLAGLGEADAGTLFDQRAEPLCTLRFRCQGAPGWLLWDSAAAVAVVEAAFGARNPSARARMLSSSEVQVARQLMGEIANALAGPLGVALADPAFVQVKSELGDWREAGAEAEAHRLEVALDIVFDGRDSRLSLFVPGVRLGVERAAVPLPAELPEHLERVEVELSAQLAGCELSLDQLLALEEGDVIPLEARLGDPTFLNVEGLNLARARLGSHRGRLAVRIERLDVQALPTA